MGFLDRFRTTGDDGHSARQDAGTGVTPPADVPPTPPVVPAETVSPLTQERLTRLFDTQGWHYQIDSDGDLGGNWDGNGFYFIISGENDEILQITSRWAQPVPEEHLDVVRQFIEDWHRDKIWPKLSLGRDSDGDYRLHAGHAVDYEYGVADSQILQHVMCAIGTSGQAYKALAETLKVS